MIFTRDVEIVSCFQKQSPGGFYKKDALKKIYRFAGKTIVLESLFDKVSDSRLATLFKKRLRPRRSF